MSIVIYLLVGLWLAALAYVLIFSRGPDAKVGRWAALGVVFAGPLLAAVLSISALRLDPELVELQGYFGAVVSALPDAMSLGHAALAFLLLVVMIVAAVVVIEGSRNATPRSQQELERDKRQEENDPNDLRGKVYAGGMFLIAAAPQVLVVSITYLVHRPSAWITASVGIGIGLALWLPVEAFVFSRRYRRKRRFREFVVLGHFLGATLGFVSALMLGRSLASGACSALGECLMLGVETIVGAFM